MIEELDLIDLLKTFWKKKMWLIWSLIVGILVGILYNFVMIPPKYASWATLLPSKSTYSILDNGIVDSEFWVSKSELSVNQRLISTYIEIIKSRRVAMQAVDNLGLDLDYEKYWKWLSAYQVEGTDVIRVNVKTENAEESKQLADEIIRIFVDEIDIIYGGNDVSIIDVPEVSEKPVETDVISSIVTIALVFLFIAVAVIFVQYYRKGNNSKNDKKVKSDTKKK